MWINIFFEVIWCCSMQFWSSFEATLSGCEKILELQKFKNINNAYKQNLTDNLNVIIYFWHISDIKYEYIKLFRIFWKKYAINRNIKKMFKMFKEKRKETWQRCILWRYDCEQGEFWQNGWCLNFIALWI